jgi:lipopolysaccharide export system protein LptC
MGERLSSLFPVVLLALLAALTYWLDHAAQLPATVRDKPIVHDPDFIADKLLATRMDVNGRVRDTLHAAKVMHFPDDDSSELESPRFASYARGSPLTITSKLAQVSSNGGNLYFTGGVRATRAALGDKGSSGTLVVTTEYLHLMPDDNIAKTDRHVTISDNRMTLEAVGMELNSETRVLKLNADVRGAYDVYGVPAATYPARGALSAANKRP